MVNSDSFGHLPLAGGEEEANDFLRDKWEAHRRTSLDAANREKEVRSVVAAAGLSGYEPAEATDDLMIQAFMEAAERRKWSPALLADLGDRIAPFLTCVEPAPEDHWVVEWVATLPEYRGRGLVKRLLEEMLDRGRTRGFARAQISVLIGNTAAERAYQGVGFRKFDDRTHPAFESAIGEPGLRRMRMNLQESRK